MAKHIRPAAERLKINKRIGWHTFRHSLASLLGKEREDTKVVQELMRHTSAKITMDVYQHGDEDAKRLALTHVAALFRDASTAI
jgi:integrase